MYKVIFIGLIYTLCVKAYYTYDEAYTKLIFNMAASAYPDYKTNPNAINACLNKSFPNVFWDVKETHTVTCGYVSSFL
jgi:spore maturation protein CgeB